MDDDDTDTLMYLAFGAALLYFLYKNNVFGPPAGSASGSGGSAPLALPPASGGNYASSSGQSAPVAAATTTAANQGPASPTSTPLEPDFGMNPGGWDD